MRTPSGTCPEPIPFPVHTAAGPRSGVTSSPNRAPLSGGTFRAHLLGSGSGARYIVAVVRATADHAGRRLDQTVCQLMRVEEAKIVEVRGHYSDEAALNAFWVQAPSGER